MQNLLDAVIAYLPSPLDIPATIGHEPGKEENKIERHADEKEPLTALAFKIATDPFVGRIVFVRTYSGHPATGSTIMHTRTGNKDRIGRLLQMHANPRKEIDKIPAGHIGAVVGLKDIRTGDSITDPQNPVELERPVFPDPVISIAVEP